MSGPTSEYARKLAAELFRKLPGRAQKVGGLPWALEPSWTETKNGRQRWTAPPLTARAVAYLRKDVLLSGREWPWEKERKPMSTKPPKGHKRDREGAKARERVAEKMSKMDQIIADFRAAQKPKPKLASEHTLDTFLLDRKTLRDRARRALQPVAKPK